jgi:hypothetical protein
MSARLGQSPSDFRDQTLSGLNGVPEPRDAVAEALVALEALNGKVEMLSRLIQNSTSIRARARIASAKQREP